MEPDSTNTSNKTARTSSTPVQEPERGLGWGEPQNSVDLAPTESRISDANRRVELIHCGNDGQRQGDLQDPHPSPPSGRTGKPVSRKRSSAFTPAGGKVEEHHSLIKRPRVERESRTDHEAGSADDLLTEWVDIRKAGKVNKEEWAYCCNDTFIYLDLTKRPISDRLAPSNDRKYDLLVTKAVKDTKDSKPQYKFSLKKIKPFDVRNCVKNATAGEVQDALVERLEQFIAGLCETFSTVEGWRNKLNDIEKKFEELLREAVHLRDEARYKCICDAFRSGFEEQWNASVDLALLSEHINRTAFQFFVQDIQKLLQDLLPQLLTDENSNLPQETVTDGRTSPTQASFLKFIEVPLPKFS
ncbi:hypothetical protein AOLI_G00189700 [Acnodon oligacanthus]